MKMAIYFGSGVGGIIGGFVPVLLWHADPLDPWSLFGGLIGGIIGVWVGYRFGKYYEL